MATRSTFPEQTTLAEMKKRKRNEWTNEDIAMLKARIVEKQGVTKLAVATLPAEIATRHSVKVIKQKANQIRRDLVTAGVLPPPKTLPPPHQSEEPEKNNDNAEEQNDNDDEVEETDDIEGDFEDDSNLGVVTKQEEQSEKELIQKEKTSTTTSTEDKQVFSTHSQVVHHSKHLTRPWDVEDDNIIVTIWPFCPASEEIASEFEVNEHSITLNITTKPPSEAICGKIQKITGVKSEVSFESSIISTGFYTTKSKLSGEYKIYTEGDYTVLVVKKAKQPVINILKEAQKLSTQ